MAGNGGRHQNSGRHHVELPDDDAGLHPWARAVKSAPEAIRAKAEELRRLAAEARDDQPMNQATRDQMEQAARQLDALAADADEWYGNVEEDCADDFSAYRTPRDGNVHKEAKSDVGRVNRQR